jgi:hypothetical protein
MKTENFDDAIRDKMEGLHQNYEDENIDKVYNYVTQNLHVPFWKNYGQSILYTSGVAAMSGLIVWNIFQFRENNLLHQKLDNLQSRITLVEKKDIEPKAETYNKSKYIAQNNSKNFNYSETGNISNISESIKNNRNFNLPENNSSGKYRPGNQVNKQQSSNNYQSGNIVSTNKLQINSNTNINYNNSNKPNNINNSITPAVSNIQTITDSMSSAKNDTSKNKGEPDIKGQKPLHQSFFANLFGHFSNPFSNVSAETYNGHISIKNLRFRAGIESEAAFRQLGIGIIGEMLLSARWSVSTGLRFLAINNEKYNSNREFHQLKGKNFNAVYSCGLTDSSASNIGINTLLTQAPISINYQLPLKNNYSLIASVGTDIDIHARQIVDYDDGGSLQNNKFTTNYPVIAFNNIAISAGLQKRWKGFVFRASPFISPQFKSVMYKKEDLYAGIKLNILLSNER